jgi:hypothetical protein
MRNSLRSRLAQGRLARFAPSVARTPGLRHAFDSFAERGQTLESCPDRKSGPAGIFPLPAGMGLRRCFFQNGKRQYFWDEAIDDSSCFSAGKGSSFLLWGEPGRRCFGGFAFFFCYGAKRCFGAVLRSITRVVQGTAAVREVFAEVWLVVRSDAHAVFGAHLLARVGEDIGRGAALELVADTQFAADIEAESGDGECDRGPADGAQGAGGGRFGNQGFNYAGLLIFLTTEHAHSPRRHGSMITQVEPGPMVSAFIDRPNCAIHTSFEGFDATKESYFSFGR